MKYGYARVSTKGQERNGNSLEDQVKILKKEGCEGENIFKEVYTGTTNDRPQFQLLLDKVEEGDTIVICKMDRFARSAGDAIALIKELFEMNVKVHILNMGLIENTPTGRLIFNIMVSFAEFERDMIVERTQTGKALAKANDPNFKDGRPKKFNKKQIAHALLLLETNTLKQVEELTGISISTLKRAKQKAKAEEVKKNA